MEQNSSTPQTTPINIQSLLRTLLALLVSLSILSCSTQNRSAAKPGALYKTDALIVAQLTPNTFKHTSFKQTNDFGYVPCNGLVVRHGKETVVFDTPTNDQSAEELIRWIEGSLGCTVKAVVPTHFHDDCLGGLQAFHNQGIPSFAYFKTREFARENKYAIPQNSFTDSLRLPVGNAWVLVKFFGEGHTRDNVVGYVPHEKVLFGGCLIKAMDASKGYLGDSNVAAWSGTVENVKKAFPNVSVVVPGHGNHGGNKLLDYTINLFRTP